ncbi:MAG TPA: hypothetical protein VLR69_13805 [Thermoanaerobaculia bacterium]|nr:hypothetical protein [Thermoanaerobaculia bacterium]
MPENHPDPQLLERFMRNEAAGEERRWIVRHLLAGCARCGAITRRLWELGEPGPGVGAAERRKEGKAGDPSGSSAETEAALLDAYRRFLGEGLGAQAAAVLLDLGVLYAREGRVSEILPLTQDMLPIFQTRDLRKGIAAALVCFRALVESGQATVGLLAEMARYVGPRPEERGL